MVAISLYRGNLHRVSDAPRRWLMPTPKISLKNFKSLSTRRSQALSRLGLSSSVSAAAAVPLKNLKVNHGAVAKIEPKLEVEKVIDANTDNREEERGETSKGEGFKEKVQEGKYNGGLLDGADCSVRPTGDASLLPDAKAEKDGEAASRDLQLREPEEPANVNVEATGKADERGDKEKRMKEIEEKLKVLTAKKHNLVQALKQILHVEEELKRRNSPQGTTARPSAPLQVDVTNDSGSGSMSRQTTPRMGSEATLGGDMEGGEGEDVSNHNVHSRYVLRMSSTSPSAESPLRRTPHNQHNAVSHASRSSLAISSSPSRFAPTSHLGNPANVSTVSVSGTNYVASSPSPAASGGTSAFRDTRQPSPWN